MTVSFAFVGLVTIPIILFYLTLIVKFVINSPRDLEVHRAITGKISRLDSTYLAPVAVILMMYISALLTAFSDAYLQVGVWVAAMLWLCGWLRERPGHRWARLLTHRHYAPVVGAALGVSPGCGGAVAVMPLYASGKTTFGAVIATLVATMGDSSFVIIAAQPKTAVLIHIGLFILGVGCGILVDFLGLGIKNTDFQRPPVPAPLPRRSPVFSVGAMGIGTDVFFRPDIEARAWPLHLFWTPLMLGLALTFVLSFLRVDAELFGTTFGVANVTLFGAAGALQCIALAVWGWRTPHSSPRVYSRCSRGLAIESVHETAPVVLWVALSFLVATILVEGVGIDLSFFKHQALLGVLAGALVGIIPGCGPQIVLTGLYLDGVVTLPMLIANAVSQDGDALLPLLAKDPKAAGLATLLTTVPAIAAGIITWMMVGS